MVMLAPFDQRTPTVMSAADVRDECCERQTKAREKNRREDGNRAEFSEVIKRSKKLI